MSELQSFTSLQEGVPERSVTVPESSYRSDSVSGKIWKLKNWKILKIIEELKIWNLKLRIEKLAKLKNWKLELKIEKLKNLQSATPILRNCFQIENCSIRNLNIEPDPQDWAFPAEDLFSFARSKESAQILNRTIFGLGFVYHCCLKSITQILNMNPRPMNFRLRLCLVLREATSEHNS